MSDKFAKYVIFVTVIQLVVFAALVCLQFFLSGRKNKWPGLIPIAVFSGFVLYSVINSVAGSDAPVGIALQVFISNLPKLLLLIVIHCLLRKKVRKQNQLEKMNIQDLD